MTSSENQKQRSLGGTRREGRGDTHKWKIRDRWWWSRTGFDETMIALQCTPVRKAEDISDIYNRKSQSALQRNQIRSCRGFAVSTDTIKRSPFPEWDMSNAPNIRKASIILSPRTRAADNLCHTFRQSQIGVYNLLSFNVQPHKKRKITPSVIILIRHSDANSDNREFLSILWNVEPIKTEMLVIKLLQWQPRRCFLARFTL